MSYAHNLDLGQIIWLRTFPGDFTDRDGILRVFSEQVSVHLFCIGEPRTNP